MKKPRHLSPGDTVAIVSLSAGTLGEPWAIHKLDIARRRLEEDYGLKVRVMPNALKGRDYLYRHPEARAADLMDAFRDPEIRGVFNAIGGEDTIRLLPYIDFDVLARDPKIFTGFSDTTSNHLMLYKAGVLLRGQRDDQLFGVCEGQRLYRRHDPGHPVLSQAHAGHPVCPLLVRRRGREDLVG